MGKSDGDYVRPKRGSSPTIREGVVATHQHRLEVPGPDALPDGRATAPVFPNQKRRQVAALQKGQLLDNARSSLHLFQRVRNERSDVVCFLVPVGKSLVEREVRQGKTT